MDIMRKEIAASLKRRCTSKSKGKLETVSTQVEITKYQHRRDTWNKSSPAENKKFSTFME